MNLCPCFHFIQMVLSAYISLLKSKHYFEKVSSHRDSEISSHSPPSLSQKKFSKQMKVLEIVCWMPQSISFLSESGQSPVRIKCVLILTESLIDTFSNANFSFFPLCRNDDLCLLYADSSILKKQAMSSTLLSNRELCSMTGQNQITQGSLHID